MLLALVLGTGLRRRPSRARLLALQAVLAGLAAVAMLGAIRLGAARAGARRRAARPARGLGRPHGAGPRRPAVPRLRRLHRADDLAAGAAAALPRVLDDGGDAARQRWCWSARSEPAALPPIVASRRAERRIVGGSVLVTAVGGLLLAFEHAIAVDAIALRADRPPAPDRPAGDPRAERAAELGSAAGTVPALLCLAGNAAGPARCAAGRTARPPPDGGVPAARCDQSLRGTARRRASSTEAGATTDAAVRRGLAIGYRAMDHTNTGQDEPEQTGSRGAEQRPGQRTRGAASAGARVAPALSRGRAFASGVAAPPAQGAAACPGGRGRGVPGLRPSQFRSCAARSLRRPALDVLDDLFEIQAIVVGRSKDVADVGRSGALRGSAALRMIRRQRLVLENVECGAGDAPRGQRLEQRGLVDDRAARSVDEVASRARSARGLACAEQPLGDPDQLQAQVDRDDVRAVREQLGELARHLDAELPRRGRASRFWLHAITVIPKAEP